MAGLAGRMLRITHHQLFMEEKGFPLHSNVILQDNKSAMLIETNGKAPYSKRSRHMNICYFCAKDLVDRKEVVIECCPTEKMIANFFTKPLQGSLFVKFIDMILGHVPVSSIFPHGCEHSKERVDANKDLAKQTTVK